MALRKPHFQPVRPLATSLELFLWHGDRRVGLAFPQLQESNAFAYHLLLPFWLITPRP